MKNYTKTQLGIYIHIPFCVSKCIYCDFLSFSGREREQEKYISYLLKEIENVKLETEKYIVKSCFFGGGTPSVINAEYIEMILLALKKKFEFSENIEITIECNPGTVTEDKLKIYKNAGINRISFGLQSADNVELKELGRIHTYEEFLESYKMARNAGFLNINVDIMSGLPYQSLEKYQDTVKKVMALKPEHISAYSLIVEEGTPLKSKLDNMLEKGICVLPSEDMERQMYYDTKELLESQGYIRYEISNYCKKGYECRHNLGYWERVDYIGFGLNAASLINNTRFTNVTDFETYYRLLDKGKSCFMEIEQLSKDDAMSEHMFLGLRKSDGVSKKEFYERFGISLDEVYGNVNEKHIQMNLINDTGERICLTEFGMDVSNVVMAEYLL